MDWTAEKEMERIERCLRVIRRHTDMKPDLALVLGSGLGAFADGLSDAVRLPYDAIEGFPVSTVPGHVGRFVFGTVEGVRVIVMQGRVHYYEGYDIHDVVLPVRLMAAMGARVLFLTNAAGGIHPDCRAGDFMLLRDHIALFFPNPLVGPNLEALGPRFPDMSRVYDEALSGMIRDAAHSLGLPLREGIYAQLTGPCFETPAEISLLGKLGVDAVGMSTACEAIAAHHAGLRVCAVSCIANKAAGLSGQPLTHKEVQEAAGRAAPQFAALLRESIARIGVMLEETT